MLPTERFALTLEQQVVPYIRSIETYLAGTGFSAAEYSAYTELRSSFEDLASKVRKGGSEGATSADLALRKLASLQGGLEVILRQMPPSFLEGWNSLSAQLESDNFAMLGLEKLDPQK